jgi:hypothetical protein
VLSLDLDQIDEAALQALEKNETPESLRLEFKRELTLSTRDEKREAAKDASALANTAGGRIVYGIEERPLPNGSRAAGPIRPLTDGQLEATLADVFIGSIEPRPRFRTRRVSVTGGFVLVLELYDSYGRDLHMVSAYGEKRFYRRHEQGTYPMTEAEIREAYLRIAASRADLERSLQQQVEDEIALRHQARESLIAVPWYGAPNLIHPRQVSAFAYWLQTGPLHRDFGDVFGHYFKVFSGGFRSLRGEARDPAGAAYYLAVMKNGLVHLSSNVLNGDEHRHLGAVNLLARLVQLLEIVRELVDRAAYWGPWRLVHVLRLPETYSLTRYSVVEPFTDFGQIPAETYRHVVYEVNPKQTGVAPIAKELLDQVFQDAGIAECPWFGPQSEVTAPLRAILEREPHTPTARALLGTPSVSS